MKTKMILFSAFALILLQAIPGMYGHSAHHLYSASFGNESGAVTTVILVRHAERDPGVNPPLNNLGHLRAFHLAEALAESGVDAVYCPDLIRNVQTAEPLADSLGIPVHLIPDDQFASPKELADYVYEKIFSEHKGQTILWIGNQSTEIRGQLGNLQEMYFKLGGTGHPLTHYDRIYIFQIFDSGNVHLIKAAYGNPAEN